MASERPWLALGWEVGALTGWGQYGAHFARSLHAAGYDVRLPGGVEVAGVQPLDRPVLERLVHPIPESSPGWLFMPLGNAIEAKPEGLPASVRVAALCVFEDRGALDVAAVDRLKAYDALIAPSRWVASMLAEVGFADVPVCHQGYDGRVFRPLEGASIAPQGGWRSPETRENTAHLHTTGELGDSNAPLIFSGGKLEFRKGQDIAIAAFRAFRETPEGTHAKLVCAWDNPWPQTMDGIWLAGHVQGMPAIRNGRADLVGWLALNGVPPEAVIDCGRLSAPELAHVMRQCTVGIFPSRAEGATNMVLVEALGVGLPCIFGDWTGQSDVVAFVESKAGMLARTSSALATPSCRLYRDTVGWGEQPVNEWQIGTGTATATARFAAYWDWSIRGPAIAAAVLSV